MANTAETIAKRRITRLINTGDPKAAKTLAWYLNNAITWEQRKPSGRTAVQMLADGEAYMERQAKAQAVMAQAKTRPAQRVTAKVTPRPAANKASGGNVVRRLRRAHLTRPTHLVVHIRDPKATVRIIDHTKRQAVTA